MKSIAHDNIVNMVDTLYNVKIQNQNGKIVTVEEGELLEPLEGGELSYHLIRYGPL